MRKDTMHHDIQKSDICIGGVCNECGWFIGAGNRKKDTMHIQKSDRTKTVQIKVKHCILNFTLDEVRDALIKYARERVESVPHTDVQLNGSFQEEDIQPFYMRLEWDETV